MRILGILLLSLVIGPLVACAAVAESAVPTAAYDVGGMIWTFVNSPAGLSVIGFALMFILGKVFTAKPKWKALVDQYKPMLIAAVKKAEKEIDDDCSNKNLKRLDSAMKFMLSINSKLDLGVLKDAITAVHAEAEKDKNI